MSDRETKDLAPLVEEAVVAPIEKKERRRVDHQRRIARTAEKHMSAAVQEIAPEYWVVMREMVKAKNVKILAMLGNYLGYERSGGGININNYQQNNTSPLAGRNLEAIIREMELKDAISKPAIDAEFTDG